MMLTSDEIKEDTTADHPPIRDVAIMHPLPPSHCWLPENNSFDTRLVNVIDTYSEMKMKMMGIRSQRMPRSSTMTTPADEEYFIAECDAVHIMPIILVHRKHKNRWRRKTYDAHKNECISPASFSSKDSCAEMHRSLIGYEKHLERSSSSQEYSRSAQRQKEAEAYPCTKVTAFLHREVIKFPIQLERSIRLRKNQRPLGVKVDSDLHEGVNGCIITSLLPGGAAERDGRLFINDYIVSINNECMRKISPATARSILRRCSLLHDFIEITYMSHKDTRFFEENFIQTVRDVTATKSLCALPIDSADQSNELGAQNKSGRVYSEYQLSANVLGCSFSVPLCWIWFEETHTFTVNREFVNNEQQGAIYFVDGNIDPKSTFPSGQNVRGLFVKYVKAGFTNGPTSGDLITQIDGIDVQAGHPPSVYKNPLSEQSDNLITVTYRRLRSPLKVNFYSDVSTHSGQPGLNNKGDIVVGELFITERNKIEDNVAVVETFKPTEPPTQANEVDDEGYKMASHMQRYKQLPGRLLAVDVTRTSTDEPIGLSLVNYNTENCRGIFIVSVFPGSPASKCGLLRAGDQVLEVNSVPLKARHRSRNVTQMLKQFQTLSLTFLIHRSLDQMQWFAMQTRSDSVAKQHPRKSIDRWGAVDALKDGASKMILSNLIRTPASYESADTATNVVTSEDVPTSKDFTEQISTATTYAQSNETENLASQSAALIEDTDLRSEKDKIQQVHDDKLNGQEIDDPIKPVLCKGESESDATRIRNADLHSSVFSREISESNLPHVAALVRGHLADPNDPKIRPVLIGAPSILEIDRGDSPSLGMTIVGGYGSHLGSILIHNIFEGGPIHKDRRLAIGDQILEVDNTPVNNLKCEDVLDLLVHLVGPVQLKVIRSPNMVTSLKDTTEQLTKINIDLNKKPGRGFGFSIMRRQNGIGAFVSNVIEGGCAEKDGRLMPGDFLLELGGKQVFRMTYDDIVYILKTSPAGRLQMVVGRLKPFKSTYAVPSHRALHASDAQASRSVPLLNNVTTSPLACSSLDCSRIVTKRAAASTLPVNSSRTTQKRSQSAPQRLTQSIIKRRAGKIQSYSACLVNV